MIKGKLSSKQEEIQKNAEVFSTTVMMTQVSFFLQFCMFAQLTL